MGQCTYLPPIWNHASKKVVILDIFDETLQKPILRGNLRVGDVSSWKKYGQDAKYINFFWICKLHPEFRSGVYFIRIWAIGSGERESDNVFLGETLKKSHITSQHNILCCCITFCSFVLSVYGSGLMYLSKHTGFDIYSIHIWFSIGLWLTELYIFYQRKFLRYDGNIKNLGQYPDCTNPCT